MGFRIHLLIQDPAGPIVSGEALVNTPEGPVPIGQKARWRAACDPKIILSHQNRGTGEARATQCAACFKTEAFKRLLAEELSNVQSDTVGTEDARPPCVGCE